MKSIADFVLNANFCHLLGTIDKELRDKVRAKGCTHPYCNCGGKLDQANYPRKIDLTIIAVPEVFELALSLCCRICRRRTRVPSVRFAGKCRTVLPMFLLTSIFLLQLTSKRLAKLKSVLKVTYSTLRRWRRWFENDFFQTRTAQVARARLPLLFGGFVGKWLQTNIRNRNTSEHWVDILKLFAELNEELFTLCDARAPPAENAC